MCRRLLAGLILTALVGPAPGRASLPNPATSIVDPCLVATFTGSHTFRVVVRDVGGGPIPYSSVVIDFSGCPTMAFCTPACTGCTYLPEFAAVRRTAGADGIVDFDLRLAGTCPASSVRVYSDGVLIATRALATPDHDGDGWVSATDVAAIRTLAGTSDRTADFDCSGTVDAADEAFATAALGSACDTPVPVRSRTWGGLKVRYR